MWMATDPTHLAGRLHIAIEPLAVVTAVSNHIGDDGAAGGGCFPRGGPHRSCRRVVRRESVMLWLAVDPTQFSGRLDINIYRLAVVTALSCRIGGFLLWVVGFFGEVVANAAVGVS